jgi:hypothetical protein
MSGDTKGDGETVSTTVYDLPTARVIITQVTPSQYAEVSAKPITASADGDTKTPATLPGATGGLSVFLLDLSGSMFNSHFVEGLLKHVRKLAQKALDVGDEALVIFWAAEVSCYVLRPDNINAVFDSHTRYELIDRSEYGLSLQDQKWGKSGDLLSVKFRSGEALHKTLPRLGFETLEACLLRYHRDRGVWPPSIRLLFSTDGEFTSDHTVKSHELLTHTFLTDLQLLFTKAQITVDAVVLGIKNDHVTDIQRILGAFPSSHYLFARDRAELESEELGKRLEETFEQTNCTTRIPLDVNGKRMILSLNENGHGSLQNARTIQVLLPNAERHKSVIETNKPLDSLPAVKLRMQIAQTQFALLVLQDEYAAGKANPKLLEEVLRHETTLNRLLKDMPVLIKNVSATEKTRTRELLYASLRLKNLLQKYAAVQTTADPETRKRLLVAADQEMKMVGTRQYSAVVAKQITRNRSRLYSWRHTTSLVSDEKQKTTTFVVQVTPESAETEHKSKTYKSVVPAAVATDPETEFMTAEAWATIYASGDTRCQAFLLRHKPNEAQLHTPSLLQLVPTNTAVALSTLFDAVDRQVFVNGYNALFESPFVGATAAETYNLALPTYAPNLEFAATHRLKQLLGLLMGGHPLAYTQRCVDVYVPAILKMWDQYRLTRSSKILNDAVLLTNAFKHIRAWMRLHNTASEDIITPRQNLDYYLAGNTGTNAFNNVYEPLIHLILCPGEAPEVAKQVGRDVRREAIYCAIKSQDEFYKTTIVPIIGRIRESKEWLAIEPGLVYKPPKQWPQSAIETIRQVLNTDPEIAKLVQTLKSLANTEAMQLTEFMCRAATVIPKTLWTEVDAEYATPVTLAATLAAAVDAKEAAAPLTAAEMVTWMTFAHELPSNSARREVLDAAKKATATTTATATATATTGGSGAAPVPAPAVADVDRMMIHYLCFKLQQIGLERMGVEHRLAFLRQRVESRRSAHGSTPLMISPMILTTMHRAAYDAKTCDDFVTAMTTELKDQLEIARSVYVETKSGTNDDFRAAVKVALQNLYGIRHTIPGTELSCTDLPRGKCAYPTCPEFMAPQQHLMQHLDDHGHDLPAKHELRMFISNMHYRARSLFVTPAGRPVKPPPRAETFMASMSEYAAQYVSKEHLKRYAHWFNHEWYKICVRHYGCGSR